MRTLLHIISNPLPTPSCATTTTAVHHHQCIRLLSLIVVCVCCVCGGGGSVVSGIRLDLSNPKLTPDDGNGTGRDGQAEQEQMRVGSHPVPTQGCVRCCAGCEDDGNNNNCIVMTRPLGHVSHFNVSHSLVRHSHIASYHHHFSGGLAWQPTTAQRQSSQVRTIIRHRDVRLDNTAGNNWLRDHSWSTVGSERGWRVVRVIATSIWRT